MEIFTTYERLRKKGKEETKKKNIYHILGFMEARCLLA
jgi:hypothetical protein